MTELESELFGVSQLISKLADTSGSNAKLELLRQNKNLQHLEYVLEQTYNPYLRFKLSRKMVDKLEVRMGSLSYDDAYDFEDFRELLNRLASSNINDELRNQVALVLSSIDNSDVLNLIKGILTKDLKIGMAATSINKVFDGLIPVFEVMRGQKYSENKKSLIWKNIIVTEKIDGVRTVAIINEEGNVELFSRQGQKQEGFVEIENEIKKLGLKNWVLDGEVTISDFEGIESKDIFKETTKITSAKIENKTGLLYNAFDCMPLDDFKAGKCNVKTSGRKKYIAKKIEENSINQKIIRALPILYQGIYNEQAVKELHDNMVQNGSEGLMINLADGIYESKRTKQLLKVKEMYTMDLEIIGFEEGEIDSKFEGTLGALIVDYKGFDVKVGSGFSDTDRDEFWKNKDNYLGRVIEVQCFEETKDKDGNLSLRFPVFKTLREVGKEVSYD